MNEKELQAWTAERLGNSQFPWELWRLIPTETREYAKSDEEEREQFLLPRAKGLLQACRFGKDGLDTDADRLSEQEHSEGLDSFEIEPSGYERQRAAAYAEYRAKLAADDRRVQGFRKQNLKSEDKLLSPEEAEEFLANNADLSSLSGVSRRLSRIYPWTEEQAAWFILTGEAPEIAPISGHTNKRWGKAYTHGTITLEVEPWISPDIVRDFYIRAQKKALGRNNRRLGDRSVALFRFVLGQVERIHEYNLRERGLRQQHANREVLGPPTDLRGRPSWREMMARWNEQFSEKHAWRYKDVRNFERDFRNAEWQIANPVKA